MIHLLRTYTIRLVFTALCFVLALAFRFMVIGFGVTSTLFLVLGCLSILYLYLRVMLDRGETKALGFRALLNFLVIAGLLIFAAAELPVIIASSGDENPQARYAVLLGAGVNGTVPSLSLVERLEGALIYLNKYPESTIIVSGGQGPGEDISEAEAMRRWLEAAGIDPGRIVKEDKSTSTMENIINSKAIIESLGGNASDIAIISTGYHLYRAKKYAQAASLDLVCFAAKSKNYFVAANYYIREGLAVLHMWVFGIKQ